jgi:hypothetical protein
MSHDLTSFSELLESLSAPDERPLPRVARVFVALPAELLRAPPERGRQYRNGYLDDVAYQRCVDSKPRTLRERVTAHLGLRGNESRQQLGALRRQFAKRYHPDRVSPGLRSNAVAWMQIANELFDHAIAAAPRA